MDTRESPRIACHGLMAREQEKLHRLMDDICVAFSVIGQPVEVCQAVFQDGRRILQFLPGFDQPPIAAIESADFISDSATPASNSKPTGSIGPCIVCGADATHHLIQSDGWAAGWIFCELHYKEYLARVMPAGDPPRVRKKG